MAQDPRAELVDEIRTAIEEEKVEIDEALPEMDLTAEDRNFVRGRRRGLSEALSIIERKTTDAIVKENNPTTTPADD